MHLEETTYPEKYQKFIHYKKLFLVGMLLAFLLIFILALSSGPVKIPFFQVIQSLLGFDIALKTKLIIFNIRLPQVLAGIVAGMGLAVSGVVMQAVLRNPLSSPYTLGISHAAAFGAAAAVMIFGSGIMHSQVTDAIKINNPYLTIASAFGCSLVAIMLILGISQLKKASAQITILAGVSLASLFSAGTMFLQYFADDTQLAAMVFWTFGDLARASWSELSIMAIVVFSGTLFFLVNAWNYNALEMGEDTAKGVGVNASQVRLLTLLLASLVTATVISFLGIIGFIGLVCPHMARRLIGDDYRFLIPFTCLLGGSLLLLADTLARIIIAPNVLPVAILTAFCGVPVFLYLILRGTSK